MTTQEGPVQSSISSAGDHARGPEAFSFLQVLRLGSFQIGSAMGDILVTSVWNRIMISNFGIPAWPVGLLIALRYLLSPLSLWAGYRSDAVPFRGLHRTPYIWGGRAMMFLSFPLLGFSLARLGVDTGDELGWALSVICFLLYGVGTLISGSTFLALVRDSVPKARQGLAISVVETTLIAFFPVAAIGFGYWLESYSQAVFWQIVLFTMGVGAFFWWFAIVGVEKRGGMPGREPVGDLQADFMETFQHIIGDERTRRFFLFLAVGTLAAWTQDNILEPFGAEVFELGVGQTTRLNAYWQAMTVVVLVFGALALRKSRPERQTTLTRLGLNVMAAGLVLLALSSLGNQLRAMQLALVIFGTGFGFYTFGALSLMVVMTTDRAAGAYLGLWTVCILVFRGLGIGLGSIARDLFLSLTGVASFTYALIFALAAAGLVIAGLLLSRQHILSFARESGRLPTDEIPLTPGLDL